MAVPVKHVLSQGPNLAGLVRTAIGAAQSKGRSGGTFPTPGPEFQATVPAPPKALIHDYLAHVGGDPRAWGARVPHHFFPFWSFPILSKTLVGVPYDLSKVLNGGCTLTMHADLPQGEPLNVSARLVSIDDDERRVLLTQEIRTGTASVPLAQTAQMRVILPKRKKDKGGAKEDPKVVPTDARALAQWDLPARAGLDFAILTGDFNPIHWIPAAGRAAGFGGCILHGFGTMARAIEGLNASVYAGRTDTLASIDVRFVRPVKLPSSVGLFVGGGHDFYVGSAPGAPANLIGTTVPKDA